MGLSKYKDKKGLLLRLMGNIWKHNLSNAMTSLIEVVYLEEAEATQVLVLSIICVLMLYVMDNVQETLGVSLKLLG